MPLFKRTLPALLGALLAVPAIALAQAPEGGAAAAAVIGPAPNPAHPIGGYLPQPPGSMHLLPPGPDGSWQPAEGYPLYVLDRECRGQCAVQFPPLTPAEGAQPPSPDWTIRIRDENGSPQWVYKGRPVYTFTGDDPQRHPMADNIIPGVALARP